MERRILYATIQKKRKPYQSQRQIAGFSFLCWFTAPVIPYCGYAAELKINPNNGLEIG